MLKLAVNLSMIFTEVPLIERFALARQQGFDAVEIQFPYELSIAQIQKQLQTHRLNLVLINLPTGDLMQGGNGLACVPNCQQQFAQAVNMAVQYATALNVPRVNILAGRQPLHTDFATSFNIFIQNLRMACAVLAQHGIRPVFEMINGHDMPRFLVQTLAQGHAVLNAVASPTLQMQYDCYHMAMMNENVLQGLQDNLAQIGHIQFADCPGRQQPATGQIDYEAIFEWLKHSNYQGFVAAEYRPSAASCDSFGWRKQYYI